MTSDQDERTHQLRDLLVQTATKSTREKNRPWRLVALVVAVAFASGATGAISAAAIATAAPYSDKVIASMAVSVARPNSVPLGRPHYVLSTSTMTIDLGETPATATGVAMRLECGAEGSFSVLIDGKTDVTVACTREDTLRGGGGGFAAPVAGPGRHSVTFLISDRGGVAAWLTWIREPPMPSTSLRQQAEMADDTVTRDEYLAAFNRYVGCVGEAGYWIDGGNPSAVILSFSIPTAAIDSGADERCYVSEFQQVDTKWQLQNQDASESTLP
jgi:hypothetical protein